MKQSLQLKLGQSLSMTPQMQQAIRMLQLSTLELRTEIQQILESNPFLDIEESVDNSSAQPENTDPVSHAEYEQRMFEQADWQSSSMNRTSKSSSMGFDESWLENTSTADDNLQDHLMEQLELARLMPKDQIIGSTIIESIDSRGYLLDTLEALMPIAQSQWDEIKASLIERLDDVEDEDDFNALLEENWNEISLEDMHVLLTRIQHFDPPGVGARNTSECLKLQLEALPVDTPFRSEALKLITQHDDAIATQNIKILLRKSGFNLEIIQSSLALLRTLEVAPGERCCPTQVDYVIPDVIAYKHQDIWQATLNPEVTPKLMFNRQYRNVKTKKLDAEEKDYIKSNIQEARWFLKSLQSRHDTLLKIAQDIVEHQQAFFEEGELAMKPMILADVARRVDMHESTISRVTTQKFIHTPRGVFELEYFFSSHVSTDDGGECSSTAIRAQIRRLIQQEPPEKPLSDSKLAKLLELEGINIARRTVAKYRELDKIPPSSERKKTF
ncbi:MAG: RNA polymerase sigma-54 factor [Gammaproteobacteria bacterium]|nr:RNA polymerase sigma-54 factor [Gammaproteobacteria bacterium]